MTDTRLCECDDWRENIFKVNASFQMQVARNPHLGGYAGKKISHCPWCGSELLIVRQTSVNEGTLIKASIFQAESAPSNSGEAKHEPKAASCPSGLKCGGAYQCADHDVCAADTLALAMQKRANAMNRAQRFEQKVSFVYRCVADDGITKEQVRSVLVAAEAEALFD